MSADQAMFYIGQLDKAAAFIRERNDFLVVSHVQPDGDAASSTLAVGCLLRRLGKTFLMINEGPIPAKFGRLAFASDIVNLAETRIERTFTNVISIDCADFSRIGAVSRLFADGAALLNIDHHPTNDRFGSVAVVKEDAAATVEIVYELAKRFDIGWPLDFCEYIYTGLLTDTGGFRYANTTPKVMKIASDLLEKGVVGSELAERFLETMTLAQISLLRTALSTLEFAYDRRVAYVHVTSEDIAAFQASSEDLDGIVNYPRNIEGVEVGILFKQTAPATFKASLRSAGKVDVSRIAQSFGGGGHVRASGCTLSGTLEQVAKILVAEVGSALS